MGALNEAFGYLSEHPKLTLGVAAALAIRSSHLVRSADQTISDVVFDNPEAIHGAYKAVVRGGLQNSLGRIGVPSEWTNLQPGMSGVAHEDIPNYYRGPNPNPDGSLVFGLYSRRLR